MSERQISSIMENGVVVNTVIGEVSEAALRDFMLKNIPDWETDPVLWDLSEMDFSNVSSDTVRDHIQWVKTVSESRKNAKTALVANDDLAFGMLRMMEMFFESHQIPIRFHVFRDKDSAVVWLKK